MKRIIITLAAAVGLVLGMGGTATAGGSGDFYKHWTCKPPYYGYSSTANLDVTNYDIATGQRYHIDVDAGGFTVKGLYFNGTKLSDWNDVYVDRSNRSSINTITAMWYYGPYLLAATTQCTIKG
jgi:hypothetical protein